MIRIQNTNKNDNMLVLDLSLFLFFVIFIRNKKYQQITREEMKKRKEYGVFISSQNYVVLVFKNLKNLLTLSTTSPIDPPPDPDQDARPADVIPLTRVDRSVLTFDSFSHIFCVFDPFFLLFLFLYFLACYLLIFLVSYENYRKN